MEYEEGLTRNHKILIGVFIGLVVVSVFIFYFSYKEEGESFFSWGGSVLSGGLDKVKGLFTSESSNTGNSGSSSGSGGGSSGGNSGTNTNVSVSAEEGDDGNTDSTTTSTGGSTGGGGGSSGGGSSGGGGGSSGLSASCTDFDNGLNYTNGSSIQYSEPGDVSYRSSSDVCLTDTSLSEQYCEGTSPKAATYNCPSYCYDGKCGDITCTDSDGGQAEDSNGTTENELETQYDTCHNLTHVKEYFCNADNTVNSTEIECSGHCREGVCVPECAYTQGNVCMSQNLTGATTYETDGNITVGVWVDDTFKDKGSDYWEAALGYFNGMNQIFAQGVNNLTGHGNHSLSFVLDNNQIYLFNESLDYVQGNDINVRQAHWKLHEQVQTLASPPDLNVLILSEDLVDINETDASGAPTSWGGVLGVSNGVGRGQSLFSVTSSNYVNSASLPYLEEWWGSIMAHEVGHALGIGYHVSQCLNIMCCTNDNCCDDFTDAYAIARGALGSGTGKYPADEWKSINDTLVQVILDADSTDASETYGAAFWDDNNKTGYYLDINNFINF